MGVVVVRMFLNCLIPVIVAIFGYDSIKDGNYSNMYKPGHFIEEASFIILSLTFFEVILYLVDFDYLFAKRKRFCCLKKDKDGKVLNMTQLEANQ